MRLWSLHPRYLDTKGLCGLWREGLCAQRALNAYLQSKQVAYTNHPQLDRFKVKTTTFPMLTLAYYLHVVWFEGHYHRKFNFNNKLIHTSPVGKAICSIPVTSDQIRYEFTHLQRKLMKRDKKQYDENNRRLRDEGVIMLNHIFYEIPGAVESWEKVK